MQEVARGRRFRVGVTYGTAHTIPPVAGRGGDGVEGGERCYGLDVASAARCPLM